MAVARVFSSVATPRSVRLETQAPAASAPRPQAPPPRNAASSGAPAGLARRQSPVHGGMSPPPAPRVGLDRLARATQTIQTAKTTGAPAARANILNRVKAAFGRHDDRAPLDEKLFENSLQCGFAQTEGLKTVFGNEKIGVSGVCAALSTIWMNVHCAAPDGSVNTRLRVVGSLEGIQHALIFQKGLEVNLNYLVRKIFCLGQSLQSRAREDLNELYGIDRDIRPIKSTSSAQKIAAKMSGIDGYASLIFYRTDKSWEKIGHEMSMHRDPEDGMITFFDPNYGEFRFNTEDAAQFLRTLREKYRLKSDVSFDWILTGVRPNSTDTSTPLDVLVDYVKANQESPPHSSRSGSAPGADSPPARMGDA